MPIPYKTTRYGCQFKCGTRRRSTEEKAKMHEDICWSNPKNKTCKSCKNEVVNHSPYDHETGEGGEMIRLCKDETANTMLAQEYESLKLDFNGNQIASGYIKPYVNCPFWEPRND
jgi:hypothetical protein